MCNSNNADPPSVVFTRGAQYLSGWSAHPSSGVIWLNYRQRDNKQHAIIYVFPYAQNWIYASKRNMNDTEPSVRDKRAH